MPAHTARRCLRLPHRRGGTGSGERRRSSPSPGRRQSTRQRGQSARAPAGPLPEETRSGKTVSSAGTRTRTRRAATSVLLRPVEPAGREDEDHGGLEHQNDHRRPVDGGEGGSPCRGGSKDRSAGGEGGQVGSSGNDGGQHDARDGEDTENAEEPAGSDPLAHQCVPGQEHGQDQSEHRCPTPPRPPRAEHLGVSRVQGHDELPQRPGQQRSCGQWHRGGHKTRHHADARHRATTRGRGSRPHDGRCCQRSQGPRPPRRILH